MDEVGHACGGLANARRLSRSRGEMQGEDGGERIGEEGGRG